MARKTVARPPRAAVADKLRAIVAELSEQFFERETPVRVLACAVLARQHVLLLGPTGTAKSELARAFAARITDARHMELLLTKFTDPKKIFGPIDLGALMRGENTQVFSGRATEAEFIFFDEIFKCSAAALNETLALLNERLYHPENGGPPVPCALISAITASNELPNGEELTAVFDRLLLRVEVDYLVNPDSFARLLLSAPSDGAAEHTTVALAEIEAAHREVLAVALPRAIIDMIAKLRTELRGEGITVSDRRWRQCVDVLRASAFLDGRPEVEAGDLDLLTCALWDSPAQRPTVNRAVLRHTNPDLAELEDLCDGLGAIEAQLAATKSRAREDTAEWAVREVVGKLRTANRKLHELRTKASAAGRSTVPFDDAIIRRNALAEQVDALVLGEEK